MALVVGAVRVLPVPAGREGDGDAEAARAEVLGQALAIRASARRPVIASNSQAAVAQLALLVARRPHRSVAHEHPEAGLESRHCGAAVVLWDCASQLHAHAPQAVWGASTGGM